MKTILHGCKSVLFFYQNSAWVKKEGVFDVTMGSFHGAEIAELVGLYLLSELKNGFPGFRPLQ